MASHWAMLLFALFAAIQDIYAMPSPATWANSSVHIEARTRKMSGVCGGIVPATRDNWIAYDTPSWIRKQLEAFRESNGPSCSDDSCPSNKSNFVDYLVEKYAPATASSAMNCMVQQMCIIGDCQNLLATLDTRETEQAWQTFEAIANYNNFIMMLVEASHVAQLHITTLDTSFVTGFSEVADLAKWLGDDLKKDQLIAHAVLMSALVIAGVMGSVVPVIGSFEALAGALSGATGAAIGGSWAGGTALYMDVAQNKVDFVKSAVSNEISDFGSFFAAVTRAFNEGLRTDAQTLLSGGILGNGADLVTVLRDGAFVETPKNSESTLSDSLLNYWTSVGIDWGWQHQWTYIIDADSPNCNDDNRGPSWLKTCLNEYPDRVFYTYYIPKNMEDKHHGQAQVLKPPGAEKLSPNTNYNGVTLDDVVRSSVAHYRKHKFRDPKDVPMNETEYLTSQGPVHSGKKYYAGLFSVPVCRNPDGAFISSVSSNEARNYPCRCGELGPSWNRNGYSSARDESKEFFQASGLKWSHNLREYCEEHMDCHEDNGQSFNFKWNDSPPNRQLKANDDLDHPYTHCDDTKVHSTSGPE